LRGTRNRAARSSVVPSAAPTPIQEPKLMRFDFRTVDDVDSFVSVPAGTHMVRIAEVREGRSRDGSVRWSFRLEVTDGDFAGRTAAWDSLTWSERGVYRIKKVLEALGVDVRGELEIGPDDLVGLCARVQVIPEEREDPLSGKRVVRMRVPYLGYAAALNPAGAEVGGPLHSNGRAGPEVDAWDGDGDSDEHGGASEEDDHAL
jgi:hypothetical protein